MSGPFEFTYLATHPTTWEPSSLEIALSITLDGCIVPSEAQGARISLSHVIVLDGLVDDPTRRQLLEFLVGKGNQREGATTTANTAGGLSMVADGKKEESQSEGVRDLPSDRWERRTADMAGAAPTWGLKQHVLESLAAGDAPAIIEIQSRLAKLYPGYDIAHLPSAAIQAAESYSEEEDQELEGHEEGPEPPSQKRAKIDALRPFLKRNSDEVVEGVCSDNGQDNNTASAEAPPGSEQGKSKITRNVDCSAFLANAAAEGDTFRFHVDADPTSFPPSPWTNQFGDYFNGEPGKPLLVTLLLYLDDEWERDWGGETLFLDGATDAGIFVRPRAGRAVLMEQDVLHRVSPPSSAAGGRMRLSLVWKLVFLPKKKGEEVRLARREWGLASAFGSAARVEAVKRQLNQERKMGIK